MIITLKGAKFTTNIGTLDSWRISTEIGSGATYSGPTSVKRDPAEALNATVTIADGYELNGSVTVTMGGVGQAFTQVGNVITISIAAVTGNVMIKVPTVKIGGSEPDVGGGDVVEPDTPTSNYTLVSGNKFAAGNEENLARASIFPYTIVVPTGVTITNKSTIKWAYYTGVNVDNMPSGSGNGTWGDYTYTGKGVAIGISFKKADDSVFDWSVDSTNPADYFDVSDAGLWNGTATEVPGSGGSGGSTPEAPSGSIGDITALTLVDGNPYGTAAQQTAKNRVHSSTALYCPAGTTISCKDTTTYKWAIKKVTSETDLTGTESSYRPDSAWTTKTSYTTEANGYWCFILVKASDANFDWSVDSNKVSDYFTVS